jgi:HEAT repeat protein
MSTDTQFKNAVAFLLPEREEIEVFPLFWLSDLDSNQARQLRSVWMRLSVNPRRDLMGRMKDEAREAFELDFSAVARIALQDEDGEVRVHAIEALWECDDLRLADNLMNIMTSDPALLVRAAAAGALGNLLYQCEMREPPHPVGATIEDALMATYRGKDALEVRRRALESVGYSSRPEVASLIELGYHHAEERMRASALRAMGRSADSAWEEDIRMELDSPFPLLRREAAYAAGELALHRSTGQLIQLLEDVDGDVRRQAIWALGEIGGEKAQVALESMKPRATDDEQEWIEDALENAEFEGSLESLELLRFEDEDDEEEEEGDEMGDEREGNGEE